MEYTYADNVSIDELLSHNDTLTEEFEERQLESHNVAFEEQSAKINASGTNPPLFVVKNWTAFATWNWDSSSDICAICRESLMTPCIQCQAVSMSKVCKLTWGECSHGFHAHCLMKWLSSSRNSCPLDNLPWVPRPKRKTNNN